MYSDAIIITKPPTAEIAPTAKHNNAADDANLNGWLLFRFIHPGSSRFYRIQVWFKIGKRTGLLGLPDEFHIWSITLLHTSGKVTPNTVVLKDDSNATGYTYEL